VSFRFAAAGWARKSSKASIPGKPRIQLDAGHVAKLEADLAVLVKEVSSNLTVFPAWFCDLVSFVTLWYRQEAADMNQSHEARVFTQWILSLNIPQLFIHNLVQGK
jgi:hypothetical protein